MIHRNKTSQRRRRGRRGDRRAIAYVLALWLLATFASMAIAFTGATGLEMRKADNLCWQGRAQMAAESGMAYMAYQLMIVRLPGGTTQADMVPGLAAVLGQLMNGTANMGAGPVTDLASSSVHVPPVSLGDDVSFQAWMIPLSDTRCLLVVYGEAGAFRRTVTVEVELVPALPRAFDYGMASRGSIEASGSTDIFGVNDPSEASIFSDHGGAGGITLSGSGVSVSGNVLASGGRDSVSITGNPSIGGTSDPAQIEQHIQPNVMSPDFPQLETAPLTALATNLVDASTDVGGTQTFTNIRIAANTDPVFAAGTVINGVIYVEAPNDVKFAGHVTINGFIVTQDSDAGVDNCTIDFTGTVDATGVDALPDTEEFAAVKVHTGTFMLAPGFKVAFGGNFETINGSIAADQLHFSGSAQGVIKGAVIGLADLPTTLEGSVQISVDRSSMDSNPAGFVKSLSPEVDYSTYREPATGG